MLKIKNKTPVAGYASTSSGGATGDTFEVVLARLLGVETSDIHVLGSYYFYVEIGDTWTPNEQMTRQGNFGPKIAGSQVAGFDLNGNPIPRTVIEAFTGSITIE